MTLLLISFIAGALTVLAPCILPLLPIVISGSVADHTNRMKPYIITFSLAVSVIAFTLLLKASTLVIDIPQSFWTYFSGGILVALGVVFIFPSLWERLSFTLTVNRKSQALLSKGHQKQSVLGDIIMGAALGPVFSTCSPTYFVILATVLPSSFTLGLVYLFAYTLGLTVVLLAVAFLGQRVVSKLSGAADSRGWIKRSMGVVIMFVGVVIVTGLDKKIETAILDSGFFDITRVEQQLLESIDDESRQDSQSSDVSGHIIKESGIAAPELIGIDGYINTDDQPITIADYIGTHVVLIDFWTYSCINCRRTTPYLVAWYERYHDKGLEIIGVHTPEFAFEHKYANVEQAVIDLGIHYPVVLDNSYATWRVFKNQYWPRKYLINKNGEIVYDHIGEGGYEETEQAIQEALRELGKDISVDGEDIVGVSVDFTQVASPEIYFGASRNEYLTNGVVHETGVQTLTVPETIIPNRLYLGGSWNIAPEYAAALEQNSEIVFTFDAKNVYMVLGSSIGTDVEVFIDGEMIDMNDAGVDVIDGILHVSDERLYHIYSGASYDTHTLRLKSGGGIQAFTFTFG